MAPSGVFGEEQAYLFDLMGVSLFTRRLRQQCVCCCAPCMTAPVCRDTVRGGGGRAERQ
jgi:hypothetical protein